MTGRQPHTDRERPAWSGNIDGLAYFVRIFVRDMLQYATFHHGANWSLRKDKTTPRRCSSPFIWSLSHGQRHVVLVMHEQRLRSISAQRGQDGNHSARLRGVTKAHRLSADVDSTPLTPFKRTLRPESGTCLSLYSATISEKWTSRRITPLFMSCTYARRFFMPA